METLPTSVEKLGMISHDVKSIYIDGNSTDGTWQYLRELEEHSREIRVERQIGVGLYEALNQGVQAALIDSSVTHVGLMHSDDYFLVKHFDEYLQYQSASDAMIFYSDIQFHNNKGRVVRIWKSGTYSKFKLNTGWMPPHTSMIVSREVYEKSGSYNTDFGTAADYEWIVRVLRGGRYSVAYFPKRTVSMRVGGASGASLKSRLAANKMDGRVWREASLFRRFVVRVCKPARKVLQFGAFEKSK